MSEERKALLIKAVKVLTVLTVIAAFGAAAYVTVSLGVFTVKEIIVSGNEKISEKEIMQRSGLRAGESSIFFFEESVEGDIKKNPWIMLILRRLLRRIAEPILCHCRSK